MPDHVSKFKEGMGPLRRLWAFVLEQRAEVAVVVLLAASLVVLGGIVPIAACWLSLAAALVFVFALRFSDVGPPPVLAWGFGVLAAFTLLQWIPLPATWVRVLSPHAAEAWEGAVLAVRATPPSTFPVSLAPEITAVEAAKWGSYGLLAWLGSSFAAGDRGVRWMSYVGLGLAVLAGGCTLAHGWAGAHSLFGVYTPVVEFPRWRMGPLLNANHLSGYLAFGAFSGLSLLLTSRGRAGAKLAVVSVATGALVIGVVLLGSRAGVALLLAGAVAAVVMQRLGARTTSEVSGVAALGVVALVAVAIALALFGYGHSVVAELSDKDVSKLEVARDSIPLVRDFRWFGVGRGAFEGAFWAYKVTPALSVWTHPESFPVQWLTEWGVVASLVGAVVLLAGVWRAHLVRQSLHARLQALAVGLLVVQNLVDYSLELPAVAGLVAFVLGGLTSRRQRAGSPATTPRYARFVAPLTVALVAVAAAARHPEALSDVRRQAYEVSQQPLDPVGAARLEAWMRRFPADPFLPLYGGIAASRVRPANAVPWLGRALERAPNLASVHLTLADVLAATGRRSQALVHLRECLRRDPESVLRVANAAVAIARRPEDALSLADEGTPRELALADALSSLTPPESPLGMAARQLVLKRRPCDVPLRAAALRLEIDAIDKAEACAGGARGACVARSRMEAQRIGACPGGIAVGRQLEAEALWRDPSTKRESVALLESGCAAMEGEIGACLELLAARAAEVHDSERVTRVLRIVVSRRCATDCGAAWSWASDIHAIGGDRMSAYVALTSAVTADPGNVALRWKLVDAAVAAGARDRAMLALNEIAARFPAEDARARARLAALVASGSR